MSEAFAYFMLGFKNAFSPVKIKTSKDLGEIASSFHAKRQALIEKERNRRKNNSNKG